MIWWKRKDGRGYTAQDRLVVTALVLSSLIVPSNLKAAPAETLPSADSAPINSVSVNPLFLPALPQLRQKRPRIPVLLPAFVARRQQYGPLTPEWRVTRISYSITLGDALKRPISHDYPFPAYYCTVDGQAVRTSQAPHNGHRVALAGGITGWYSPPGSSSWEPFAMIGWRYKTGDYSIGLAHATQAELVAMANSAIQHPLELRH